MISSASFAQQIYHIRGGRFAWNFIVKTVAVAEAEVVVVVVVDVAVAQSLEGRGGGVR